MTKHQTVKHRKQRKKERANRKAKQHQQVVQQIEQKIIADNDTPMSPARRAFQNL